MKKIVALMVGICWLASAVPAHAMNWSIGANLGYAMLIPSEKDVDGDGVDDLENISQFSWPSETPIPGIRIGFAGDNPMHEFYLDTGLFMESEKDVGSSRHFTATANYQFNFGSSGPMMPYATAGAGIVLQGFKDETSTPEVDLSATSTVFGGGIGVRHKMGNGHGVLRAEARYDMLTEGKDEIGGVDVILQPKSSTFQVKLGFDLWDK